MALVFPQLKVNSQSPSFSPANTPRSCPLSSCSVRHRECGRLGGGDRSKSGLCIRFWGRLGSRPMWHPPHLGAPVWVWKCSVRCGVVWARVCWAPPGARRCRVLAVQLPAAAPASSCAEQSCWDVHWAQPAARNAASCAGCSLCTVLCWLSVLRGKYINVCPPSSWLAAPIMLTLKMYEQCAS